MIEHLQSDQPMEWRLDSTERTKMIVSLVEAWRWSVRMMLGYFALMGKG